jgi:hypothetical protein
VRALVLVVVLGCGGTDPHRAPGYGFAPEGVDCYDDACRIIERHLADLRAQKVTFHQCAARVLMLGERAVPTLRKELATEQLVHVRLAAYTLTALGHGDEVAAWCRTLGSDRDGREITCQE